jgi:NAD(P)-dependent dehydrogenase (short-subunit alcohol dehydrogenase family)
VPLVADRILVVGAGSGIGRALSIELVERGVTVYAAGRRQHRLAETADLASGPGRVVPLPCDITVQADVDAMFMAIEADGPVPCLVNCAAAATYSPAIDLTVEQFDDAIGWSLLGGFKLLHRWGRSLLAAGAEGTAITLTSGLASRGTPGVAHSSAGKAGLEALTKALAREWGPDGLRLNAVGVGLFPVEKSNALWADEELRARNMEQIALARHGELPEIVGPILFLLSEAATFITGHVLHVEGGVRLPAWPVPPKHIKRGLNNQYETTRG